MPYFIETILFDCDGVLVDAAPDIASAANYTLAALGLKTLPAGQISGYIGGGAEVLVRRCLRVQDAEDEARVQQALALFNPRYDQFACVDSRLYPGVEEVLEHYRRAGKRMGIATQKKEAATRSILEKLGILDYFDILVGPESVQQRKPHPEALQRILEHTRTRPHNAVMVGDAVSDIQAGKAAGTLTCGVTSGYGAADDIRTARPDVIVDRLAQMLERFQ